MESIFPTFCRVTSLDLFACLSCNKPLQNAVFDSAFYPNLFTMLLAFIVIALVVAGLVYVASKKEKNYLYHQESQLTIIPLLSCSIILGIGLGGFIDGIALHQILQWHEMLSNKLPPDNLLNKSVNMFWDGIFHAFSLLVTITGILCLLNLFFRTDVIISKKSFMGGLLLGWGIFNIIEGLIDHHLLKLHNVREITDDVGMWNYGFLIASVVMIVLSIFLIKSEIPKQVSANKFKET